MNRTTPEIDGAPAAPDATAAAAPTGGETTSVAPVSAVPVSAASPSDGSPEPAAPGGRLRRLAGRVLRLLPSRGGDRLRFAVAKAAAEEAQSSGDFATAYDLWKSVWAGWPSRIEGIRGLVECALERDRPDRAADLVRSALKAFPESPRIVAAAARLAQKQGDWPASIGLWERVVDRRDAPEVWHVMYGQALLCVGRFDDLERHLDVWQRRLPEASGLLGLRAMLAGGRGRWEEAVAVWRDFRRRFPADPVGWEHYGRALQELEFARMETRAGDGSLAALDVPARIDVVEDEAVRALLMGFESIGADCEFGLVQRRYGAEPLSLLRFNAVELGGLMSAVALRFSAMGEAETTELVKQPNGEFLMRDRRWGLVMHTFAFEGQVDPEVLAEKYRKRVGFLKERFLSDAAEARKVLVYHSATLGPDDPSMLLGALRTLGPVRLLHVRPHRGADDPVAPGRVIEPEAGLFVGALRRSGRTPSGAWDILYDDWVSVCRAVHARLDDHPAAVSS